MELRHLRYFAAVAEEEHFGRAARRAHVVQPALTKAVQQLERELGVALLERLPRGVRLTEAGRVLLAEAREILARVDAAAEAARRAARGEVGTLAVGIVEGLNLHPVFLAAMADFRARAPGIALELRPGTSAAQAEALREGRLHLALVQSVPEDGASVSAEAFEDPLLLAVPPGHPLAGRAAVPARALDGVPFVWFRREASPAFHDAVAAALRAAGARLRVAHEVPSHVACGSLVASGAGATLVPASMAATLPPAVSLVPVPDLGVRARVHAVWRSDRAAPAVADFLRALRAARAAAAGTDERSA